MSQDNRLADAVASVLPSASSSRDALRNKGGVISDTLNPLIALIDNDPPTSKTLIPPSKMRVTKSLKESVGALELALGEVLLTLHRIGVELSSPLGKIANLREELFCRDGANDKKPKSQVKPLKHKKRPRRRKVKALSKMKIAQIVSRTVEQTLQSKAPRLIAPIPHKKA